MQIQGWNILREFTLPKERRLKSQKSIAQTFDKGKTVQVYPVRVFYHLEEDEHATIKVAFAVSRRNFKRAVDRNRIKRIMREAYRLNQYLLKDEVKFSGQLNLIFLYYLREKLTFSVVEKATQKVLRRLAKELNARDD